MAEYINLGRTDDRDASLDPIKGSTDAISIHGLKYVVGNKTYNLLLSDDLIEYGDNDHVGPERGETDGRANMSVTNASFHGPLNSDRQANLTNQYYHRYTNYKMNSDGTISTNGYSIPSGYDYFETSNCLDDHCDDIDGDGNKYYYCSSHTRSDLKNTQHGYSKYSDTTCSWTKRNITLHFKDQNSKEIATDSQSYYDYVNGTKKSYSFPGYSSTSADGSIYYLYSASGENVYGTVSENSADHNYNVDVTTSYSLDKSISRPTISINPTFYVIENRNDFNLKLTCSDESALQYFGKIEWSSENESIVKIKSYDQLDATATPSGSLGVTSIKAELGSSIASALVLTPPEGVSFNALTLSGNYYKDYTGKFMFNFGKSDGVSVGFKYVENDETKNVIYSGDDTWELVGGASGVASTNSLKFAGFDATNVFVDYTFPDNANVTLRIIPRLATSSEGYPFCIYYYVLMNNSDNDVSVYFSQGEDTLFSRDYNKWHGSVAGPVAYHSTTSQCLVIAGEPNGAPDAYTKLIKGINKPGEFGYWVGHFNSRQSNRYSSSSSTSSFSSYWATSNSDSTDAGITWHFSNVPVKAKSTTARALAFVLLPLKEVVIYDTSTQSLSNLKWGLFVDEETNPYQGSDD